MILGITLSLASNQAAHAGGGDVTAPVLSSPVGTKTGQTTATIGATTDEGNGTLYGIVSTSATQPTASQIKAGQMHTGSAAAFAGSVAVASTGAKTISATGLTAATTYYSHLMHEDASANQSNRVVSASFTTDATWTPASTTLAAWYDIGDITTLWQDTAGTSAVTADGQTVKRIDDKSGNGLHLKVQTGGGYIYRTNSGKPYVELNGATDYFASDGSAALFNGSGEHSMVAVISCTTTGQNGQLWQNLANSGKSLGLAAGDVIVAAYDSGGTGVADSSNSGPAVANTPFVAMGVISTTTKEAFFNNISDSPAAVTTLATTNGRVWAPGYQLTGRLYELWCSKEAYSSGTRSSAQTYGAAQY